MGRLRNFIKDRLGLYDIEDLQVGAHCGCCGRWVPGEIIEKCWPWAVCDTCSGKEPVYLEKPMMKRIRRGPYATG